jgi:hypothetical protein
LWAGIDKSVVDKAYWVPMYNRIDLTIVSERVGNYQANPFIGVLVDQLWDV